MNTVPSTDTQANARTVRPDAQGDLAQLAGKTLKVVRSRVWRSEIWHRVISNPATGAEINLADANTVEGMQF